MVRLVALKCTFSNQLQSASDFFGCVGKKSVRIEETDFSEKRVEMGEGIGAAGLGFIYCTGGAQTAPYADVSKVNDSEIYEI